MRQGKFKFILVALFVVSGLLFAGGEARAAIFTYSISGNVSGSGPSSATYTYTLAKTGDSTLSYIDFEIPAEIMLNAGTFSPSGNQYFSVAVSGATAGNVEIYDIGIGDFGTKFGVGDPRYRVMKVNLAPPTSVQPFTIALTLKGQAFGGDRRFGDSTQSEKGAILVKAGNGSNTLTFVTVPTPTVVSKPPDPLPAISSFSANPNPVYSGQCTTLTWIGSAFAGVSISPSEGVTISGNSAQVCPVTATNDPVTIVYTITATGSGGVTVATTDLTVNPAPSAPAIEIARQTIEKKDAAGNVTGNITFYFENGVPACSCTTGAGDLILDFPCNAETLPTNCSRAFLDPLLVCIPFPGISEANLFATCVNGSGNCKVLPVTPCSDPSGSCFARCDTLEYLTLDTTIEVGPHSCTCTTSKVRLLNGTYKTITSCSGTPCP